MTTVEISTAEELVAFAARVNAGETTLDAKLTADIILTGNVTIGNKDSVSHYYYGTINGNGFTINGNNQYHPTIYGGGVIERVNIINCQEVSHRSEGIGMQLYGWFGNNETRRPSSPMYIRNVVFDNCKLDDYGGNETGLSSESNDVNFENVILTNSYLRGGDLYGSRYSAGFLAGGQQRGVSATNCVSINTTVTGSYSNSKIASRNSQAQLANNYATSGGDSATGYDGLNITPAEYKSKDWWQNTAGYDFENTWYWDSTENLPKLRVFRKEEPKLDGNPVFAKVEGVWKQIQYTFGNNERDWKRI